MKKRNPNDKILDNKFNNGDINYENLKPPEIDVDYSSVFMEDYKNNYDFFRDEQLEGIINKSWLNSIWYKTFGNRRRIPKEFLGDIYHYFRINLKTETYTKCEVFLGISRYLNTRPEVLYQTLAQNYKEEIMDDYIMLYRNGDRSIIEERCGPRLF